MTPSRLDSLISGARETQLRQPPADVLSLPSTHHRSMAPTASSRLPIAGGRSVRGLDSGERRVYLRSHGRTSSSAGRGIAWEEGRKEGNKEERMDN